MYDGSIYIISLMIKTLLTLNILFILSISKIQTQKKAAIFDILDINLEQGKTQTIILKNLDQKKALMFNVQLTKNEINFSIFSISLENLLGENVVCNFTYLNNLCVVEKTTKQVKAIIQCKSSLQKCLHKIVLSQRIIINTGSNNHYSKRLAIPGQIYKLQKRRYNSILQIYAERQQHQVLSHELLIYSNFHIFILDQVQELDTNTAIYGLKHIDSTQDQYIFIDNLATNNEHLKFSIKANDGELKNGTNVVDFLENFGNHSKSRYSYFGNFDKNIQINMRIFSPRNPNQIKFTLKVYGKNAKSDNQVQFLSIPFNPINFNGNKFYDFTYAITKKVHSKYKIVTFQAFLHEVDEKSVFFQIQVQDLELYELSIHSDIFIASQKKESLKFIVEPQVKLELADGDKDIQILTNANQHYFSNISSCSLHDGCQIEITTQNDCISCSFKFDLKGEDVKNQIIFYNVENETIEGKIDIEEQLYFKYYVQPDGVAQIIVDTVNVMIYANFENYEKCKLPKATCHQYVTNKYNPIIIHNKIMEPSLLIIGVVGLEKTAFKIRFLIKDNYHNLQLGQRFIYLLDSSQTQLDLRFLSNSSILQESTSKLNFNLISPTNSLKLTVTAKDGQPIISYEGYIVSEPQQVNQYDIHIQKIGQYVDQSVHFTFIVSSDDIAIRLDSTITHYERYGPKALKRFIMEYSPTIDNAINIYTENLQKQQQKMILTIKVINQLYQQQNPTKILTKDYEFIKLDDFLQELDICVDLNCELQLTISNQATIQMDQSLTVITEESLINLDDSIWAVFSINQLSKSNHFYFIPRHQNKSINILFNTDDTFLYINYHIHNTTNSINPQNWPFRLKAEQPQHIASTQQITISWDDSQLRQCWPTCVVIISLNEVIHREINSQERVVKSYKILASNSFLELPEGIKLQFSMKSLEVKTLFIMVKHLLNRQTITFYTYYFLGRAKISAKIISKNGSYQLGPHGKSFALNNLETKIQIIIIRTLMISQQLNPQQTMIQITIQAETDLKMSLQYASVLKDIQRLKMDDLEVTSLEKGEEVWYEFIPERDFSLKLYRIKGFPLFKIVKCQENEYIDCFSRNKQYLKVKLQEFLNIQGQIKTQKNEQISTNQTYLQVFVEKNFEMVEQSCEKCIYYLWIYCYEGNLELSINLRTSSNQIELKQMSITSDRIQFGHHNNYFLNIYHDKDAFITLRLLEGTAEIILKDAFSTLFNQTMNYVDNDFREITIEPKLIDQEQSESDIQQDNMNYRERLFRKIHLTVKTISEKPVQVLISYSNGDRSLYLEDGIVIQKDIQPKTVYTFFYLNKNKKQRAYLTLNSESNRQTSNNEFTSRFYYYPDASNRNNRQQFKSQLPPRRNQNYIGNNQVNVYQLPSNHELYEVEIQSSNYLKITASVNHQELIYLPIGFKYFIKLQKGQLLNLVVANPETEFLQVNIKKCDKSTPVVRYTNDALQFKKKIFEVQVDIDNNVFKQYIATKKKSKTIHIQLISDPQTQSLLTIEVAGSTRQKRSNSLKFLPGNSGLINYQINAELNLVISFKPVLCSNQKCTSKISYFLIVSTSLQNIYGELNCAGNYFIPQAQNVLQKRPQIITITQDNYDKLNDEYVYKLKMTERQVFIGVRAVSHSANYQTSYLPIEITNIWGQISKISTGFMILAGLILALVMVVLIIASAKFARRGYKPISSQE